MRKVYLIRFKMSTLRHSRPILQREANEEVKFLSELHPSGRDYVECCTLSEIKAHRNVRQLNEKYGTIFEKFKVNVTGEEERFDYYAHCRFYYYETRILV